MRNETIERMIKDLMKFSGATEQEARCIIMALLRG